MATTHVERASVALIDREPVTIINAIIGIIEAGIAVLVAFGLNWSPEQIGAVMGFAIAVGAVVSVLVTRARVTPVADPRNDEGQALVPTT